MDEAKAAKKRRALRRAKTMADSTSTDYPRSQTGPSSSYEDTQAVSTGSDSLHSAPEPVTSTTTSPTPVKSSKPRKKLWDSFLNKTRRIRIRKGKGHDGPGFQSQRASSQPNIPSAGCSPSHESYSTKTFPSTSNGLTGSRNGSRDSSLGSVDHVDNNGGVGRPYTRNRRRRQDRISYSSMSQESGGIATRINGVDSYEDLIDDFVEGSGGSNRTNNGRLHRTVSDPYMTPEVQPLQQKHPGSEGGVSFDDEVRVEYDDGYGENEGNITVIEKTSGQVSKSVDSLLTVAPISPAAYSQLIANTSSTPSTRREHGGSGPANDSSRRGERPRHGEREETREATGSRRRGGDRSLEPSTPISSLNGPVRRHSYDISFDDLQNGEQASQFFDCLDGVTVGTTDSYSVMMTSSSPEASPIRRAAQKRGVKESEVIRPISPSPMSPSSRRVEHHAGTVQPWTSTVDAAHRRQHRQQTMSSVGQWSSLDKDSLEYVSDVEDNVSSNAGDGDSRIDVISENYPGQHHHLVTSSPEFLSVRGLGGRRQDSHSHGRAAHAFYMLHVTLREGRDLVVRDSCGTSDPYVKFKYNGKQVHKSRTVLKNLNPRWDESFSIPVEDVTKPLNVKVYDYDRAWNDDPMGSADIEPSTLDMDKDTELKLLLSERGKSEYMGYLIISCHLVPKSEEDKDQFFRRSVRSQDSASKKVKLQPWTGIVNIVLVEGTQLVPMDDNGLSDPYVKFKLGQEKYRSKHKPKTLNPRWLERFDLRLYDEQVCQLEITVFDHDTRGKDDFMGRAVVDMSQLEKEKTHEINQPLEDGAGTIKLLLTISGTYGTETSSDLACYTPSAKDKDAVIRKYSLLNSLSNLGDVGQLQVKVFRAHGLHAADFGGFSDPFCVLELVNDRVQTQTEYKTLNPEWAKVFNFDVKDVHSVLEVTVFDEDRNKKTEFLGKIAIPLLRIRNGERRWYALKDKKLLHKTKGAILLEMDIIFNQVKAAIRTVNPREEKIMEPEQKFKIALMKQNVNRLSQLIGVFMETGRFVQSCFDWQSPARTISAFIVYLVIVWNFELYMLPISLLLLFMKNLLVAQIVGSFRREPVEDDYPEEDDDEDDEDKEKTEEKKSIMERYHAIQEVCLQVQQGIDSIASLGERVKNTFNWSVPWLSGLAVCALTGATIVLFYIPLRYLLLAWGVNKFTKKLRKPDALANNELLDFLSRIPSDNELIHYRELRPDIPANTVSTKKKRS